MYLMISNQIKLQVVQSRQDGLSIKEIANKFNMSQSTASLLVRGLHLNAKAKKILIEKASQGRVKAIQVIIKKREGRQKEAVLVAESLLSGVVFDQKLAFLVASISYECEGGKSNFGVLEFTNSDPVLVRIFLSALRKSFKLDESKFRVVMHLHSYHNENKEKLFWSKITSVPVSNFTKTFKKQESGLNIKEGYRGCVQIKYFDVSIKRKLLATKLLLADKMGL